jgi:hypothetical protein
MLQAAIDHDLKSAVVVWGPRPSRLGKIRGEPEILKYRYEQITLLLRERDDVGVLIIADQPGGGRKDRMKWLSIPSVRLGRGLALPRPNASSHRS